jgi:hypothetical protein
MIKRKSFSCKYTMSTSLQTTVAAEAHLAEGQNFLEEQILNREKFVIYQAGPRRPTISKREGNSLEPR